MISVDQWDQHLDWALWIRAAERIEVPADEVVTGPPDVDPLPQPSLDSGDDLAEGWVLWWRTLVARTWQAGVDELTRFSPPDFDGLTDYPTLRQVIRTRWREANAWHSARKRAGVRALRATAGQEGAVVGAVEAEIGRKAAPFSLRIIVVPVLDQRIRSAGTSTFLVPERLYAGTDYDDWLRELVRTLA
ncbi:MAG TPA: hypothetical protein VH352_08965 [Pseudonocardiaceae bacterium]|nr:hypothetical protein [Pseudonocardiaceae bacterium]